MPDMYRKVRHVKKLRALFGTGAVARRAYKRALRYAAGAHGTHETARECAERALQEVAGERLRWIA